MRADYSGEVYFGYPIPNCCISSGDADRFFCEDLHAMGREALECERAMLANTLHAASMHGVTRSPKVFTPDGNPRSFAVWARGRMERIDYLLGASRGAEPA